MDAYTLNLELPSLKIIPFLDWELFSLNSDPHQGFYLNLSGQSILDTVDLQKSEPLRGLIIPLPIVK